MGVQQVPCVLFLTFSIYWGGLLKAEQVSDANCTYHHDGLSLKLEIAEIPLNPMHTVTHDKQRGAPLSSSGKDENEIYASENILTGSASVANASKSIVERDRERQKMLLKILKPQKTKKVSIFPTDEASLAQMLAAVVKTELRECDLVFGYDPGYSEQAVVQYLLPLHNLRQVVHIHTTEYLTKLIWTSPRCRGYLFLVDDSEALLTFIRDYQDTWDYRGRYVLVLPSLQYLEAFMDSNIGRKTEHIVGVVKSGTEGEWVVYMNQLYWGQGVKRINTWYRHRFTRQLDLFPDKLSNFKGAVIKVSGFHFAPYNFHHRADNGSVAFFYGTDVEIVRAVGRSLNFTPEFMETPNGETFGEMYENGSWFGLMGQIQRHEVDIGIANVFISKHWLQVIDLTAPYRIEVAAFLTRVEPPLPQWQALAFPFRMWTWLAVVVGLILSGPILCLFAMGSGQCGGEIRNLQDLSFAWYYAFGLHFCEAHKSLPRNPCTQVFVQFLWLYTLIMTISYTASLKSFLITKKKPHMIQTIKELYESGLEVVGRSDLYYHELASTANPYLQGLAKVFRYQAELENLYIPVLQGTGVYLENSLSLVYLVNKFSRRGVSVFRIMKEPYRSYSVGLGLQRNSALKRKLDVVVGWIRQSGLYAKFTYEALKQHASLEKNNSGLDENELRTDGVVALSLDNMQGLFIITVFGWLFGALSFILEKTVLSR